MLFFGSKIYRLRKKYDRIREKADREGSARKRLAALRALDQVESTLVMLEEQKISRFDRGRMITTVRMGIEQAKSILDQEISEQAVQQTPSRQYPPRRY